MNKKAIIITAVSLGVAGIAVFGGIKAYQNYKTGGGKRFVAADIGIESEVWSKEQ